MFGERERIMETVFIVGKGRVDVATLDCALCGDEGCIVTGWEDSGDAENGPGEPVATSFEYCTCAAGIAAEAEDDAQSESYIAMLMDARGQTRAQVIAELDAEQAHTNYWTNEEARWEERTEARNR